MKKPLNIIPYKKELVAKARYLRKNSTPGEIELWKGLKGKQVFGYDFDRQKPVDHFIEDFYCKELKLAIEVDGRSHGYKAGYDKKRELKLNSLGVSILRFSEKDAKKYTESCLKEICTWIKNNPPLSPPKEGNTVRYY